MEHIIDSLADEHTSRPKRKLPNWEIIAASLVGSVFVTIADILVNKNMGVTTQIAGVFRSGLPKLNDFMGLSGAEFETLAFGLLVILGLGLCFVYRPNSRPGAFVRGSSVLGVLAMMNTGVQLIPVANAENMIIDNNVQISYDRPEKYGPFGVGTALTGQSNARLRSIVVLQQVTVPCSNIVSVGSESYCVVTAHNAEQSLEIDIPDGTANVWIKR